MNRTEEGIALYLGEDRLRFLQQVTVGIAGAGGLGSNCAMSLVRSGFRKFVIVDFDRVDSSNLNRQAYFPDQVDQLKVMALTRNLLAINPDLELDVRTIEVTPVNMEAVFMGCDVIVEAFDVVVFKKALVETFLPTETLIVSASGIGGTGNTNAMKTRKIRDNLYMIGDMETECTMENPPFSPKVTMAAAMQADVVLNHYLEKFNEEGGAA